MRQRLWGNQGGGENPLSFIERAFELKILPRPLPPKSPNASEMELIQSYLIKDHIMEIAFKEFSQDGQFSFKRGVEVTDHLSKMGLVPTKEEIEAYLKVHPKNMASSMISQSEKNRWADWSWVEDQSVLSYLLSAPWTKLPGYLESSCVVGRHSVPEFVIRSLKVKGKFDGYRYSWRYGDFSYCLDDEMLWRYDIAHAPQAVDPQE